tara:strand:+ start:1178 stop:1423 length:246 start_codon:yes stop_codon:yes gene_type:complete
MIDGKQMYEFIKKYRPNDLGTAIIDYVEQLKADKQALEEQLTLTNVSQQRELLQCFCRLANIKHDTINKDIEDTIYRFNAL